MGLEMPAANVQWFVLKRLILSKMALGTFVTSLRRRCVHSSQRLHYLGWNKIYSCSLCHKRVIGTKITNSEKSWEGFKSNISWQGRKILDTSWPPPKPWSKPCHDYDHDQLTINHCQHFFSVHDVSTCQKVRGGPWVHGWCCPWGWGQHTPARNSLCGQQVYTNHSFSATCIKI